MPHWSICLFTVSTCLENSSRTNAARRVLQTFHKHAQKNMQMTKNVIFWREYSRIEGLYFHRCQRCHRRVFILKVERRLVHNLNASLGETKSLQIDFLQQHVNSITLIYWQLKYKYHFNEIKIVKWSKIRSRPFSMYI